MRCRIFFLSLLILIAGCNRKQQKPEADVIRKAENKATEINFELGKIYPSVSLTETSGETFALYLPHEYNPSKKNPAIIFFDPHGDGSFPLNKYKTLADKFGFVLVGSNDCKNGLAFEQTNILTSHLIAETEKRFSVDASLITLAGFSGGARVALLAATNHPEINAVIYCGAGMPPNQISNIPPALGIAGTRDMNYSEVTGMDDELGKTNISHQLIEWNGKHEWSDSAVFENAFTWSLFEAMRKNNFPKNETVIKEFISENSKSKSNPLDAELQLRKIISFVKGLVDVSDFEKRRAALLQSAAFKKSAAQKKELLETESRMRQNYIQCFDTQDLNWWKEEAVRMKKIKSGTENEMYQRLLGYLSLACFSFSNSAINGGNVDAAKKALAIYQLVDSANSDRAFLSARLSARLGNTTQAIASLNEALQLGFSDKSKLESEETFASLRENPEFLKIEAALK